ncbi:MAG TPA: hypothetical protein PKK18_06910 [Chitinophagales bacterium]|nr:hypothetical protein [Chitinophagales bacterium]HMW12471.1 hypothetical protein [Chitinophagales bacterium]HMX59997.1 hypothetical protein [Chitinophagales bacterium]HMY23324.1 hypothetical protein [Chitinophagales bacterium]HMZ33815.1 hypothetical protein [Chitinophagales bacterium]
MKTKIKQFIPILLLLFVISINTGCKKDKIKIQTQLPSNYTNQGTINVVNKNISICIYDNSVEDGDIIDLLFNGNTLISDYEILNTERCFTVSLENGDNWIGINVDNEGSNPPASVTVKINDGTSEQEFDIDGEVDAPGGYIIKL